MKLLAKALTYLDSSVLSRRANIAKTHPLQAGMHTLLPPEASLLVDPGVSITGWMECLAAVAEASAHPAST